MSNRQDFQAYSVSSVIACLFRGLAVTTRTDFVNFF